MHAVAGMAGLVAIAWLLGEERASVPWRAVLAGIGLELVLALMFLKVAIVKSAFLALNDALLVLERATQAGTGLVFGYLGGAPLPFAVTAPEATFILAFRALLPRRSRPRLRLFFLPSEKLLQQPLEMRMDRQLRAVKQDFVVPRDADGGEVLHFQLADLVGLVLDVDPAELGLREFPGEREEPGAVVDTGIAPLRAKAAHDQHA